MKNDEAILLIMPRLVHGGAEKQFRFLRENLNKKKFSVVTVLADDDVNEDMIWSIGKRRNTFLVHEFQLFLKVLLLKRRYKFKKAIVYDLYGQFLIPFLKIIGVRVLYAERNSGMHRTFAGKSVINQADIVTTNSIIAINNLKKFIKKRQIVFVPNGVLIKQNLSDIVSDTSKDNTFKICLPARIAPIKNQILALKAIKELRDVELHIAGKVEDIEYLRELKMYVFNNNLNSKVYFDGFISDMNQYYHQFDLILLTSLEEGTSNVILEAYSLKKICLMSDIEMNKNIATTEISLFISNSVDDLVKKINIIRNFDEYEREFVVQRNFEFVASNFSFEKMLVKYAELLSNM